jgi:putative transposase
VHYLPSLALSTLVNRLKGVSSRRLRQEFPAHVCRYQQGPALLVPLALRRSCGGTPLSIIKEYIEQQKRPD